jgi:hypothetical protein
MHDSFYTPSHLSETMLSKLINRSFSRVADFSIGNGELLTAASKIWETANYYGTDISKVAINKVRKEHPSWTLEKCDFFSEKSRKTVSFLRNDKKFDLILLNPPFSCKGGTFFNVKINGRYFRASTSLAFIGEALTYLENGGCLVSIIPNGVASSERDRELWEYLSSEYSLTINSELGNRHFQDCSPYINIIALGESLESSQVIKKSTSTYGHLIKNIFRGKMQMHSIVESRTGSRVVHTTNIIDNSIRELSIHCSNSKHKLTGPAVLIPRVGMPQKTKICIITNNEKYVLSDCIIALQTTSIEDANSLKDGILRNWEDLVKLYTGTGAKYITLKKLKEYFNIA